MTLQSILDQYQQNPNTIVCLAAGSYQLTQPLRLGSAHSGFTIDGCDRGAVFSVPASSVAGFQDGMLVLDNATGVTLRGLHFNVPEVPFTAPGGQFAGLPLTSLAPQVQAAVQGLYVSIGVRAVNATGLTVENCEFGFGDFEEDPVGNGAVGIGIFGSGANDELRLTGNEFGGVGPFLAGYLLASTVAFNAPAAVPAPPGGVVVRPPGGVVIRPPGGVVRPPAAVAARAADAGTAAAAKAAGKSTTRGKTAAAAKRAAVPKQAAVPKRAAAAPRVAEPVRAGAGIAPAILPASARIPLQSLYGQNVVNQTPIPTNIGVLETSGYLGKFITFAPAGLNLAANGGSVLPATLSTP